MNFLQTPQEALFIEVNPKKKASKPHFPTDFMFVLLSKKNTHGCLSLFL